MFQVKNDKLAIYFDQAVLSMRPPDGLFDGRPSPLLAHQMISAESPERIENIKSVLERAPSARQFEWHGGRQASDDEILTFHTPAYLATLKAWDATGKWATDTTYLPKGGLAGVRAAAGTTLEALTGVLSGKTVRAYALVRPPSHHAAPDVADGYCFVNCIGVAAQTALAQAPARVARVAIVDWDVHHGNGTQQGFYERDDVLVISLHMDHGPWGETHPQTGGVNETGRGAGEGYNLNLPLVMGCGDDTYKEVMERAVIPALDSFKPDLIIVSNGQDASQFDPNGRQLVTMAGFHALAGMLKSAADRLCDGKILIVQEGGYNVAYVGFCAYATALGFSGLELDLADPLAFYPADGKRAKELTQALIKRHPLLG